MPFPFLPVLATAGIGTLGYLLFGPSKEKPTSPASPNLQPSPSPSSNLPTTPRDPNLPPPADVIPKFIPGVNPPAGKTIPENPVSPLPAIPSLPSIPTAPIPIPVPAPIEPSDKTGTVTAPSGLRLRSSATTSSSTLELMIFGTRVKLIALDSTPTSDAPKGWWKVSTPSGKTGYASAEFISPDAAPLPLPAILPNVQPPAPIPSLPVIPGLPSVPIMPAVNPLPPPPIATITATVVTQQAGAGVNVRSTPNGAIVVGVYGGNVVTVIDPTPVSPSSNAPTGWIKIQTPGGVTGFVAAQFLRINAPSIHGESLMSDDYELRA